jgi:hypothetical protein
MALVLVSMTTGNHMARGANHSQNWGGSRRGAGRPRGSLGKINQIALDLVSEADEHPLQILLKIASHRDTPINVRAQACASILPYCMSRLSSSEITVTSPTEGLTYEQMIRRRDELDGQLLEFEPAIEGEVAD